MSEWFEEAWNDYPRKEGRAKAWVHFRASIKSNSDLEKFSNALSHYCEMVEKEKRERRYIKQGSAFFNQWRDYVAKESIL